MRRVKPLMASRDKTQQSGFFDRRRLSDAAGVSAQPKSHPNLTRYRVTKIRCSRRKTDKHLICNVNSWRARQDLNPRPPNRMDAPLPLRRQLRQSGSVVRPLNREGASIMKITTVGVDLAKIVFQIHGVDERGKAVLRKQLKRTEMLSFF